MDNRIIIEMTTTQTVDLQEDRNTQEYHGRYREMDDKAVLQYMHVDEIGRTQNRLELAEQHCCMITKGDMDRTMEFIPGKRTTTSMRTPLGVMDLDIVTHAYTLDVYQAEEPHMKVVLVYDLYSGGNLLAENRLEVKVRPASIVK